MIRTLSIGFGGRVRSQENVPVLKAFASRRVSRFLSIALYTDQFSWIGFIVMLTFSSSFFWRQCDATARCSGNVLRYPSEVERALPMYSKRVVKSVCSSVVF